MEFEPIRWRLARQLHARGVHSVCHERQIRTGWSQPVSYTQPDGTVYTPRFNTSYGENQLPVYKTVHS